MAQWKKLDCESKAVEKAANAALEVITRKKSVLDDPDPA